MVWRYFIWGRCGCYFNVIDADADADVEGLCMRDIDSVDLVCCDVWLREKNTSDGIETRGWLQQDWREIWSVLEADDLIAVESCDTLFLN